MFSTLFHKIRKTLFIEKINKQIDHIHQLEIDNYLQEHLYTNPKYLKGNYLNKYEYQTFSQSGEDGIIAEIYNRIGTTNKYFVEFGVENGTETNTTNLLLNAWQGLWIDGSKTNKTQIEQSFSKIIKEGKLQIAQNFITAENIEQIFSTANVPERFDLLSIDIDRNDYYVWEAITNYQPRVVVIEYNSIFRPGVEFVVDYEPQVMWDKTSHFGGSLESYCKLGEKKGYKLVGCSFSGTNAFFVQSNLAEKYFHGPFSAANFYEPPRYFLLSKNGHPRKLKL